MAESSMQPSDGHKSCNILLAKVTLDNDKHMAESSKGSSDEHKSSNLLIAKGALNMCLFKFSDKDQHT